jgi:predicted nucleic acid-binding protein
MWRDGIIPFASPRGGYVAGRDHPLREPARRFLDRVRTGDLPGCTSTEVLQEILYRYTALKRLELAGQVYELFVQLCPVVFPVTLADTDRAKTLVLAGAGVRDAVHAAVMLNNGVSKIATFDSDFDRIEEVERIRLD